MSQPIARCAWPAPPKHGRPDLTDPCIPSRPSSHNDRQHTRPATHRSSSLTTPDRLSYLTAQDAQLHRRLAVSPVLESGDRHPHSDADSHAARTMQPIRSTALFPTIRRTGQQTRIASPPRRWHRRTTVPQTGQRTGHSARRGTVSYSEIPLSTSRAEIHPTPAAPGIAHVGPAGRLVQIPTQSHHLPAPAGMHQTHDTPGLNRRRLPCVSRDTPDTQPGYS